MSGSKVIISAEAAQAIREFERFRAEATGSLKQVAEVGGRVNGVLASMGLTVSAAALIGVFKGAVDAADGLNDLSKSTKIAVADLAGLKLAANQSGTDLDGVAKSINKLTVEMGRAPEKFARLGVTAKDPIEAFKQFADVFAAIEDPQTRAALGAQVLGKSWESAAPMLAEGGAAIGAMIEKGKALNPITQEMADRADEFNDRLAEMEGAIDGLKVTIATDMIPGMTDAAGAIETAYKESGKLAAVWVSLGALGKFLFTDEFASPEVKLKNLREKLGDLETYLDNAKNSPYVGFVQRRLFGGTEEELEKKIAAVRAQIKQLEEAPAKAAAAAAERRKQEEKDAAEAEAKRERERKAREFLREQNAEHEKEKKLLAELSGLTGSFAGEWDALTSAYKRGKITTEQLTKAQADLLAKQPGVKAGVEALAKAEREAATFRAGYAEATKKVYEAYNGTALRALEAAKSEADGNVALAKSYGMTALAIEKVEIARLEEQLAQRAALGLTLDEIELLQKLIAEKKRNAGALSTIEDMEKQRAMWESIEQTAHDTFVSIFDSGKSAFDRLRDTLKNGLMDMLYQMTVKKWIIQVQGSTSGGGGIGGMISNFGSMFGSAGGGLSSFGDGMGMTRMQAARMGGGGYSAGASFGAAIPIIGWIAAGMAMANSMYKQGWDAQNGSLTDSYGGKAHMPFNAPMLHLNTALQKLGMNNQMANMFSGASTVARLFGRKNPEVERFGIEGSFGAGGFSGGTYADILQKGGLFRSSKRHTETGRMDADTNGVFNDTIKSMMASVKEFGGVLGVQTTAIDSYTKQIKLQLTNDEEKNKELVAQMFSGIGDELATRLLPTIGTFRLAGETAGETLQRIATNYSGVDAVLRSLNLEFGMVGTQSIAARERLVSLSGGLEALAAQAESFAQNYLTEAERLEPVRKYVSQEMARLGYASVDTRDEFKALVLGLDLTTASGAQLYADLMKVQAAFAQVHPAIGSALSLADATNVVAESFRRAEESARAGIERYTAFGASIRDLIDGTKLGGMSPLTPEQKYAEATAQYKAVAAAALTGDASAQARYREVHDAWLQISQTINGGDGKFVADYMVAQANNQQLLAYSSMQISVEQAALDAARAQVSGILAVEQAVKSLPEAIAQYFAAGGTQPGAQLPPVAAPAPAPSSTQQTQTDPALLAELQALRREVAALRAEQPQHTGTLANAIMAGADHTANKVNDGARDRVRSQPMQEALD